MSNRDAFLTLPSYLDPLVRGVPRPDRGQATGLQIMTRRAVINERFRRVRRGDESVVDRSCLPRLPFRCARHASGYICMPNRPGLVGGTRSVLSLVNAKGDSERDVTVSLEEGLGPEGCHVHTKAARQVEARSA